MKSSKKNAALLLFVFAAGAGLLASQVKTETKVSDITLANIEALADIELPPVEVVCSSSPYDGIGKCWQWVNGVCIRTDNPNYYCSYN